MEDNNSYTVTMDQPSGKQSISKTLSQYDFHRFTDRLKFLHHQLAAPSGDFDDQYRLYLQAGCRMFGADAAFVVSSLGSVYRRITVYDAGKDSLAETLNDLEEAVYRTLVERTESLAGSVQAESPLGSGGPGYQHESTLEYFGAPLAVSGNKCGALSFISRRRFNPSTDDIETLELMAEGVARMVELQSTQERNRIEDIRGFATAGVKSLDEYIRQARLPEVYGVSGRVIEVLERRIGNKPLAIDYVAEELNLSKRTLQRRLQQQNISFAQLRDQVRYHFSIDYLVHQALSIDAISAALDFSDRTSFTNAFKRWTSLSPSTFRKLFRDYA